MYYYSSARGDIGNTVDDLYVQARKSGNVTKAKKRTKWVWSNSIKDSVFDTLLKDDMNEIIGVWFDEGNKSVIVYAVKFMDNGHNLKLHWYLVEQGGEISTGDVNVDKLPRIVERTIEGMRVPFMKTLYGPDISYANRILGFLYC